MFARYVAKLVAATTQLRNARRTRLHAEALEAREVPAMYWWRPPIGSDLLATTATNWYNPDYNGSVPGPTDDVAFSTFKGSNFDCFELGEFGAYNSVTLFTGYTGTVTLGESITVVNFTVESGTVDQPSYGDDITVTGLFGWSGGTINSTSNVANVKLDGATDGATGTIAPLNEGAVLLGSNLSVINAAVLTMYAGTVGCLNSEILFTVADEGFTKADPGFGKQATVTPANGLVGAPRGRINAGGKVEVASGTFKFGGECQNRGQLAVSNGTTVWFTGTATDTYAYSQIAGDTQLFGNCKLKASKQVLLSGGKLATKYGVVTSDATIETPNFVFSGGQLKIGDDANHAFGILTIEGEVLWTGGTYFPFVEETDATAGDSDLWKSTGLFTIGRPPGELGGPSLAPTALSLGVEVEPTSGLEWLVIQSDVNVTTNNGAPNYNVLIWDLVPKGQPVVTELYVKAK